MRLCQGAGEFASYLIKIGDGDADVFKCEDAIELPPYFRTGAAGIPDQFAEIGRQVAPDLATRYTDERYMVEGAVLATKNEDVDRINSAVMSRFPGDPVELQSADIVLREGDEGIGPSEFLNSLDISGRPPHLPRLKIGAPVMLLRNLNPDHDRRNGTKAIVRRISQRCLEIKLFAGGGALVRASLYQGSRFNLPIQTPRLLWCASSSPSGRVLRSLRIRVRGETLLRVGIYLQKRVFSHGELYAPLSRAKKRSDIRVVFPFTDGRPLARNVVFKELLS